MRVAIAPASLADIDAIMAVQADGQITQWTAGHFQEYIQKQQCWLAKINNEVVGFIVVSKLFEEAELLNIAVLSSNQRQGIAQQLFTFVRAQLVEKQVQSCFLEVAVSNVKAQALYDKLGFNQVGLRRNYYQYANGQCEDAILMGVDL